MMMTPRSVAMGNKVFKLHLKHGNNREVMEVSPDTSLAQLGHRIADKFQVPLEEQKLMCNGKPLNTDSNSTIKQAKIPNGSKILVHQNKRSPENLSVYETGDLDEGQDCEPTGGDRGGGGGPTLQGDGDSGCLATVETALGRIEAEGGAIEESVLQLKREWEEIEDNRRDNNNRCKELKRLERELGKKGELLMKLFENLDSMQFTDSQGEAKSKRKQVATFLNRVLDSTDAIVNNISQELDNSRGKVL